MKQSSRIATRSTRPTPARSKGSAPSTRGKGKAPLDRDSERANKPPAHKRQKTKLNETKKSAGKGSRSTKRGKLAVLQEMPLDILFEIFSQVDVVTLFYISRTCKSLRDILMSRSSNWIWKSSYLSVPHDLPPLPEDVGIPKFLSLIFDRVCHYCPASRLRDDFIIWGARARACKKCLLKTCHVKQSAFLKMDAIADLCNDFGERRIDSLFPLVVSDARERIFDKLYPATAINRFVEDYERDGVCDMSQEEKEKWLQRQEADLWKLKKHAEVCKKWENAQRRKKLDEDEKIITERRKEIVRRLEEMGWKDEMQDWNTAYSIKHHALVNKAQPFTEKVWNQIRDPMVQYFQQLKAEREAMRARVLEARKQREKKDRYRYLCQAYSEFRLIHPFRSVFPGIGDIITWKEVVDVLEGTPLTESLSMERLRAVIDALPKERFDKWRADRDAELVKVLNMWRRKGQPRATVEDLKLATTLFKSQYCTHDLPYPLILKWRPPVQVEDGHSADAHVLVGQKPWSAKHLTPSERPIGHVLVELAGLDPTTATPEDMDALDPWYADGSTNPYGDHLTMSWRYALTSFYCFKENWGLVLLTDEQAARAREKRYAHSVPNIHGQEVKCKYCDKLFEERQKVIDHLTKEHRVKIIESEDIVFGLDFDADHKGVVYLEKEVME
ncbi:hypothetical protein K523DRAFT_296908 [Schizophyllum commune Tattone D]|nr:hypothetical protein K523DRAFT_296908 [Schizophyllum commune Tattone D]